MFRRRDEAAAPMPLAAPDGGMTRVGCPSAAARAPTRRLQQAAAALQRRELQARWETYSNIDLRMVEMNFFQPIKKLKRTIERGSGHMTGSSSKRYVYGEFCPASFL